MQVTSENHDNDVVGFVFGWVSSNKHCKVHISADIKFLDDFIFYFLGVASCVLEVVILLVETKKRFFVVEVYKYLFIF